MSWEPRDAIGFSPCGMAFGAVRKAYKAPARFFADDPAADNQIIWYNVPDGTEIYDDWTVFTPRVDTPPNEATNAYEREGLGRIVRAFYDGADVFGFPGTHTHGDPEDFQGLALRKKYYVGDVPPLPPCPDIRVFVRFVIGLALPDEEPLGCGCGGGAMPFEFDVRIDAHCYPEIDGLVIHVITLTDDVCHWQGVAPVPGGTEIMFDAVCGPFGPDEGYAFLWNLDWGASPYGIWGVGGVASPADFSDDPPGFSFTGEAVPVGVCDDHHATVTSLGFVSRHVVAVSIAVTVIDGPPPPETLSGGLTLGLTVTDPPPPPIETMQTGVEFGLTVADIPPPSTFGIAMGMIVSDP